MTRHNCIVCGRFASKWEPMPSGGGKFDATAWHCGLHDLKDVTRAWHLAHVDQAEQHYGVPYEMIDDGEEDSNE